MLQRLPTAFSQLKAGNASQKVFNKTHLIIYSLYQPTENTKKIYDNFI